MRALTIIAAGLIVGSLALGQAPRFRGPEQVQAGGAAIDLGYYTAPTMQDWNGDGLKDMIVGQYSYGYIACFENIGSDTAPVFSGYEYLQASGQQIQLPYG